MKKSMSFIAAIAMAATMVSAIPASAAEEKTLDITYGVDAVYTLTIPANAIDVNTEATFEVKTSDVCAAPGQQLVVTVKGSDDSSWVMTDAATEATLDYALVKVTEEEGEKIETAVAVEGAVITAAGGAEETVATLKINPEATLVAGTYADKLTFTADFAAIPAQTPAQS